MKDINQIMLNPIRMRIIQTLSKEKSITTNELCEILNDVPRTTLYRHIKLLIENNILCITSEKKIRGSVERTISLNIDQIVNHNTIENGDKNAFGFLMCNYSKFHNYFSSGDVNPAKDKVFLNNTVLMMSDNEFDQFLIELRELFIKYDNELEVGRKARDISIISAPTDIKEKNG